MEHVKLFNNKPSYQKRKVKLKSKHNFVNKSSSFGYQNLFYNVKLTYTLIFTDKIDCPLEKGR
ncbi:protein of unknown function [Candidatus Nitrosocosmicus franklandus]|uniref:Uncharacterized protein n=1 Tax=Candidatus Nitrosocosmicus franklandianus TaxID=1798806 RepID=A0A484I8H7_9ARCH|nr:protein of unknown function [Candidatus Nitrosocosmicus franklandus]